jgi:hypothetical protein
MSSIWLSSCTCRGSILLRRFLLQEGAAAAVARERRGAESKHAVALLVELDLVSSGRRGPVACEQQVTGRAGHEEDVLFGYLLVRPLRHHLLGRGRRSLVEQRDNAVDQLCQPVDRREKNGRWMPPSAPKPHLTRLRAAGMPPCRGAQPPGSSPATYRTGTTSELPA